LQSNLDFARRFHLNLTSRYVSALPAIQVHAYITGDARFAWQPSQQFEFSVVGQNLFQPYHYEYAGSDPGPPIGIRRAVYAQITWKR
jgi:iron complex outermembrane receptor protein